MDAGVRVKFNYENNCEVEGTIVRDDIDECVIGSIVSNNKNLGEKKFLTVTSKNISNLQVINNPYDPFANKTSRTKYLEECLSVIGAKPALRALRLVMGVMNKYNGYERHNGTDYFLHLVDVTQILYNYGVRDVVTLTAALLHDFVEDCYELGYDLAYVNREFGPEVAFVVDKVTKKPGIDYKIHENMVAYLADIFTDWRSSLIKVADRIHNFGTLGDAKREKILKQCVETKTYFIPFFKDCRNKYVEYAAFFFAAKTMVEPHIREIEAHQREIENHKETHVSHENKIRYLERELQKARMQLTKRMM